MRTAEQKRRRMLAVHAAIQSVEADKRHQQMAGRVVRDAAVTTMFASRLAQKPHIKGGLGRNLYARNANGQHATDPVSLNRIPASRAVKVGKHHYDSKTLRALFAKNQLATNPLTRQPFPQAVYKKYGPSTRVRPASALAMSPMWEPRLIAGHLTTRQRIGWNMAMLLAQEFQRRVQAMPQARRRTARIDDMNFNNVLSEIRQQGGGNAIVHGYSFGQFLGILLEFKDLGRDMYATFTHATTFDGKLDVELYEEDGTMGEATLRIAAV
jgi:hypothetical protein